MDDMNANGYSVGQFPAANSDSTKPPTSEKKDPEQDDAELVRRARECYRTGIDATSKWREDALQDLQFLAGEQWDPNILGQRQIQSRPALTVNRLPQFVRQVTNEQRQQKNAITVNPVDSGSDVKTAEVLQGIIRNIEYTSNADAAYAKGGECAAITGLGYWDVCAEYEDEKSFDQRLTIRRITNPMSVVMDPGAKELAGDDARWAVISTDISDAEWESKFPGRDMPHSTGWEGEGDSAASWVAKSGVRIHEYRHLTEERDTLIEVPAGMFADIPGGGAALESELHPDVVQALIHHGANIRPTVRRKACWAKIAGSEVIEKGELAGRYLQLVRVVGTDLDVDGEAIYEGVIRHAKDTQRMLNYFVSAEAEAIALAPKAPWIMAEGQDEGYEADWESANQKALSRLVYKPTTLNGQPVPPPQRVMAEANISAITNARMQAADDLKAVTGIYDAALGARSNEQSGRAIIARTNQAQTANFHFQDNLAMAIRYTGRICIDLIPKIYTGPRVVRILGEDGKSQEMVPVNGHPGIPDETGKAQPFRGDLSANIQLDAGKYDVAVSMGPSYQSKRQEAVQQLLELIRVNPGISQVAGDLLVRSMDIPGGEEIADRLQKLLPPDIKPPDAKQPPPQVLAQQLQQSQGLIQQLTQALNIAHDTIDAQKDGLESKERIEMAKLHVQLLIAMAATESKENIATLMAEAKVLGNRLGLLDFAKPMDSDAEPGMPQPMAPQMPQQAPPQGMDAPPMPASNGAPPDLSAILGTHQPGGING